MDDDIINTKPYIIYKLTLNNKVYIGLSGQTLIKRIKQHIYSSRTAKTQTSNRYNTILSHAIRKYGADSIVGETLETVIGITNALEREAYYISFYDSTNREKGYNMMKHSAYGNHHKKDVKFYSTDAYRQKRSEIVSGEKNGRYSGYTDEEIIDEAIKFYKKEGHLNFMKWISHSKIIGIPIVYGQNRFNGLTSGNIGFYESFFKKCHELNIQPEFSHIFDKLRTKKSVIVKNRKNCAVIFMKYFPEKHISQEYVDVEHVGRVIEKKPKDDISRIKNMESRWIDAAVKCYQKTGNMRAKTYKLYRKSIGLPQVYTKIFNGRKYLGVIDAFLKYMKDQNIHIPFKSLICVCDMKVYPKIRSVYAQYYDVSNIPEECETVVKPRRSTKPRFTSEEIIEHAIQFFLQNGNIYPNNWEVYREKIKITQKYSKRHFDGEGKVGFYRYFLDECKKRNIVVEKHQLACWNNLKKDKQIELDKLYDTYKNT